MPPIRGGWLAHCPPSADSPCRRARRRRTRQVLKSSAARCHGLATRHRITPPHATPLATQRAPAAVPRLRPGVRGAGSGVRSAECRVQSAECRVQSAECRVRIMSAASRTCLGFTWSCLPLAWRPSTTAAIPPSRSGPPPQSGSAFSFWLCLPAPGPPSHSGPAVSVRNATSVRTGCPVPAPSTCRAGDREPGACGKTSLSAASSPYRGHAALSDVLSQIGRVPVGAAG